MRTVDTAAFETALNCRQQISVTDSFDFESQSRLHHCETKTARDKSILLYWSVHIDVPAFFRCPSEGAAKTTMCALLTGVVLNIALDPLFIYVFDLGVAGAAIATAISQVVSTCVYLTYIFRKKSVFHFRVKDCTYTKETMSEIFKIGIPTLVFQILTSVSISLINNAAGDYGDSAIAGMGVVTRLIPMGSLSVFGFIKGFQPIAGYSYGAKKFDRLREAIKTSILWSTAFCVIFGVILALFPTAIVSQFTKGEAEMIRIGAASLRANGISIMLFGFYTVYSSLFLALGKGRAGFILGACRQGICFIPVILLLPTVWGLNGIMYTYQAILTGIGITNAAVQKSLSHPMEYLDSWRHIRQWILLKP